MNGSFATILHDLYTLSRADSGLEACGTQKHKFELQDRLTETEVGQFEEQHGIQLPIEYRQFLLQVGNGGAGPCYGISRLGEFAGIPWEEVPGLVGDLAAPFPFSDRWNEDSLSKDLSTEEQYQRQDQYWSPQHVNGAIPICDAGDNLRFILIVNGSEKGTIWLDDRADWQGIYPVTTESDRRVSFLKWYRSWLDDQLDQGT
ncbi:SMI1/KNR4 family protein [Gimesia sp.]|uniref:SMI1/KNR4 family protein n=1 Tax=Gimesia sp. TaxID=2024833 RepID=UPI003A8CFE6C